MGLQSRIARNDPEWLRTVQEIGEQTRLNQEALRRILAAAQYVVDENDLVDDRGICQAPVGVRELADALEELPLALRQHYGLHA